MIGDQLLLFGVLLTVFALLLWGRIRYDVVAFGALIVATIGGAIPQDALFDGFAHPATVIIALVLVISEGLKSSGAIEVLARYLISASRKLRLHIAIMSTVAAALSAVMNNVAALALLMPVDMQAARKAKRSPALSLMPVSFASILGGMVTLIGTPPNVVIATFREQSLGSSYSMFDFAPVGLIVAIVGVTYVTIIGWKFIPVERRKHNSAEDLMDLGKYIAEGKVKDSSIAIDKTLQDLRKIAKDEHDVGELTGLVREDKRLTGEIYSEVIRKGDVIVMKGLPQAIEQFIGSTGLEYAGGAKHEGVTSETRELLEVVVPEGARIAGHSADNLKLLRQHEVTLLGVSRNGRRFHDRVRKLRIKAGDMLLLIGNENILDVVDWLGCLPLGDREKERPLEVVQRNKAWLAVLTFAAAVLTASVGLLYLPVALGAVAVIYLLFRIVPPSQVYDKIQWPVIILLGCLIPIGTALEESGGTALIAQGIVDWSQGLPVVAVLAILMIVTMTLSDVLNNVATALIAAPIGLNIAQQLGVSPDPFLMAVAVAASCAFLTPIGHKNNTIIMGPGGYKFGDYWRMGLPLEILVVAVGLPVILLVWPLAGNLQ